MQKFLFLCLFSLVALSTNQNSALAISNEDLYKQCKPFADRAFKQTDGSEYADLACAAYIAGALEYAQAICFALRGAAEESPEQAFTRSFFGASRNANIDAVIQAYVNKVKNEPDKWDYQPNAALRAVFVAMAPCE